MSLHAYIHIMFKGPSVLIRGGGGGGGGGNAAGQGCASQSRHQGSDRHTSICKNSRFVRHQLYKYIYSTSVKSYQ